MKPELNAVVVVDSDQSWLKFCQDTLEKNKYTVYTASSGEGVRTILSGLPNMEFKLILIDERILSANKNITDELGDLAQDVLTSAIVLFATGMTPQKLRNMFIKLGVFDCLNKPFNEQSLIAMIEQVGADYHLRKTKPSRNSKIVNRILIVEDDPDWRSSLTTYLPGDMKNVVETATNYQTAVEMLQNQTYDLAIFDLSLKDFDEADFDGMNLIRALRYQDEKRGTSTPVIVVSAYGTPDQIRETFKVYSINYYFDKKYLSPTKYQESVMAALR